MTVVGVRHTSNQDADIRELPFSDQIHRLEPDIAPLLAISNRLPSRPTNSFEFNWYEKDTAAYSDTTDNSATSSATQIPITTPEMFGEHDVVKVSRTGEVFLVLSVDPQVGVLNVKRGIGNSGTGVAINNADELVRIGSAQPQGDLAKTPRSELGVKKTNYTQIFREPISETNTASGENRKVNESVWDEITKDAAIKHKREMELAVIHGKKELITTGATPRAMTGGILSHISTRITDMGGTMTETELETFLRPLFRYNNVLLGLMAPLVISVINAYAKGKLELVQSDKDSSYGVSLTELVMPLGRIKIANHWLFEQDDTEGRMVVLNMSKVRRRHKDGGHDGSRDTKLLKHREENSRDGRLDEFLSEVGLEFGQEKTHGTAYNITG